MAIVLDPRRLFPDPDPTFQVIPDLDRDQGLHVDQDPFPDPGPNTKNFKNTTNFYKLFISVQN